MVLKYELFAENGNSPINETPNLFKIALSIIEAIAKQRQRLPKSIPKFKSRFFWKRRHTISEQKVIRKFIRSPHIIEKNKNTKMYATIATLYFVKWLFTATKQANIMVGSPILFK